MERKREQRGNESAFSLMEVLVALIIISIAVTAAVELFSADLRSLSRSEGQVIAAVRGESRIHDLFMRGKLKVGNWEERDGDGFRYAFSVSRAVNGRAESLGVGFYRVHLTVSWNEGSRVKSQEFETFKLEKEGN